MIFLIDAFRPTGEKLPFLFLFSLLWESRGGFAFGKDICLSAWQASLPISEANIRTRFRFAERVRVNPSKPKKNRVTARATLFFFWSKWRDSNSRPPVPEQIRHCFLTTFVDFLVLFSPKTMLS
ncbi:MAG: hypothetical protein IJY71_06505, partial [Clostridia bacterium]|nr:hypothetical protein [Clostridia bacterium]